MSIEPASVLPPALHPAVVPRPPAPRLLASLRRLGSAGATANAARAVRDRRNALEALDRQLARIASAPVRLPAPVPQAA